MASGIRGDASKARLCLGNLCCRSFSVKREQRLGKWIYMKSKLRWNSVLAAVEPEQLRGLDPAQYLSMCLSIRFTTYLSPIEVNKT